MPTTSTKNCWIAGAILGLLVWLFTAGIGTLGWFAGLFLGLIAAVLFGSFLVWALCRGHAAMLGDEWSPVPRSTPIKFTTLDPEPRGVTSETGMAVAGDAMGTEPVRVTGQPQPVERDPVIAEPVKVVAAPDAQARPSPAKAPPSRPNVSDGQQKKATRKVAVTSGKQPDNLKEIKGVGPKLEETLHEQGITRFAQIAAWTEADIDHFAEIIGRMGSRIRADDWVGQAKLLAAGGETEFSQRVEKGQVY
jgi:predicted flap endonuclease-1-like 5' DNA nuclease